MTPTQKDIERLKEIIPQFMGLRHNYIYGRFSNAKRQTLRKRVELVKSRIRTLIKDINSRFINSTILEITYIEEDTSNKYQVLVTDVTPDDIRLYFQMLRNLNVAKYDILEIREIQDKIKILPL